MKVKIVDDVGKVKSNFVGKEGVIIGYKPNKFREGGAIPIFRLDDGQEISGWGLFYEPLPTYREVLSMLSHQQTQELLKENFGEINARYHTLDEIPFYKLTQKLQTIANRESSEGKQNENLYG